MQFFFYCIAKRIRYTTEKCSMNVHSKQKASKLTKTNMKDTRFQRKLIYNFFFSNMNMIYKLCKISYFNKISIST